MRYLPILFTNLLFIFVLQEYVQAEKYPFRNFSVDDGLDSPYIWCIYQDTRGYLWFGTNGGVCKFDGINFTSYTTADGLVGNEVSSIIEDKDGTLWFSTWNSGVSKYDGKNWISVTTSDGLASNRVCRIFEDSKGNLWFGDNSRIPVGLSKLDGEEWVYYTSVDGLVNDQIKSIMEDSKGRLWFGGQHGGVFLFDGKSWIESKTSGNNGIKGMDNVMSFLEDSRGNIWVSGHGTYFTGEIKQVGYFLVRLAGELNGKDYYVYAKENGLPNSGITAMEEDREGNIWFTTATAGLVKFDGRNFETFTIENGLSSNYLRSIIEDRGGNLWVGSWGGGICSFKGSLRNSFTIYTKADGLIDNSMSLHMEDIRGNLWFTSSSEMGINTFDGEKWATITTENGLGSNKVWDILDDSKGNVWFACGNVLSKFNGEKWKNYESNEKFDNFWITQIHLEDRHGNLWVGDNEGNIYKFDGRKFERYGVSTFALEKYVVFSINEDKAGNMLFGTADKLRINSLGSKGLIGPIWQTKINLIYQDRYKNHWFGTERGVIKANTDDYSHLLTYNDRIEGENYTELDGLSHNNVLSIVQDNQDHLWFGTNGNGVSRFDGKSWRSFSSSRNELTGNVVHAAAFDSSGSLWFGTDKGVSRFDGEEWESFDVADGLADSVVNEIVTDRNGHLWFGTSFGITRFDGEFWNTFTEEDGLADNRVKSILSDSKGSLWCATATGISSYDGKKWYSHLSKDCLNNIEPISLYEDSRGIIWVGTNGGGVYSFDGNEWSTNRKKRVFSGGVKCMLEDSRGNLWFTLNKGVIKFDGQNWEAYESENELELDEIQKIVEDNRRNVWFGTFSRGLTCFDGKSWKTYTKTEGLASNDITTLYVDNSGSVWLGSLNSGVSKWDGTSFTKYTTENGLPSNTCLDIVEYTNCLYFLTPVGIARFDGNIFKVYHGNDEKFASSYLYPPLKVSKGNLWFCSKKGVIKCSLQADEPNLIPPLVYLTGITINGRNKVISDRLELSHDQNDVRFDYVGISLTDPEHLEYLYKLDGFNKDWRTTNRTYVSYPSLPAGKYTFRLRAENWDGVLSESQAELAFIIFPPYWDMIWFKGTVLIVVVMMLLILNMARNLSLRKKSENQQREIEERKQQEEKLANALDKLERLKRRLQDQSTYLQREIKINQNFEEIVGCSLLLQNTLEKVEKVAASNTTVLILGETGTGKELIARGIHHASTRSQYPLVKVNCSALPENLIESELFGHEKGAFTGAYMQQIGLFKMAHDGTIFLDEIGELPINLQSKLLRVLESGEFQRLGSPSLIKVDVRVIAASNLDLEAAVEEGKFRKDFFYRLNVYPIYIHPLRDRKEDIPPLVHHFVKKFCTKTGKQIENISQDLMNSLQSYHWPGNVRELENIIERAVIISHNGQLNIGDWIPKEDVIENASDLNTLEENERSLILKALKMTGWRVSGERGAARILNINPKTLDSKMRKLGIRLNR